jgi:DNA-binding NtrC family response regulator
MSTPAGRLLVVEDKATMRELLERILSKQHQVDSASDGLGALAMIAVQSYEVILTDVRMPGADGFAVVRAAKAKDPATEVIVMTAFASIESAVEAMRQGAYDYLQKPFDPDDVVLVVARALERCRLHARAGAPAVGSGFLAPGPEADIQMAGGPPTLSYRDVVNQARDNVSREYLSSLLRAFDGNVTRAAQQAGLERESLHRLLKRYQLRADAFRAPSDDQDSDDSDGA